MFSDSFAGFSTPRRMAIGVASSVVLGVLALPALAQSATPVPPFGLPDRGQIRLQLGTVDQFLFVPPEGSSSGSWSQSITLSGKCGYSSSGNLVVLTATGGLNTVGLGPESIGVADGPKGVACYRITSGINEVLTASLGTFTTGATIDANAFYRLELDIEVKSNAEFVLEILKGSAATKYYLRTGSSIVPGVGEDLSPDPNPDTRIFNCTAQSDSGPDSGSNDNCRWTVDALGQSFRLYPKSGEGSLEGGGDHALAYANNSVIYLTEGEIGSLGCENSSVPESTTTRTIGDGSNDAKCAVTRIDPTGFGGSCTTAVGYVFRNIGFAEGCELIKSPGEQLAASIDIEFPPEPARPLGEELPTRIEFSNGQGGTVQMSPPPGRCRGTVVRDQKGNRTIKEVLLPSTGSSAFLDVGAVDQVPSTPAMDWACILDQNVEYLGPLSNPQMQVHQTILFWGDISFARQ